MKAMFSPGRFVGSSLVMLSVMSSHVCAQSPVTISPVPTLGGRSLVAFALNDHGQLTGYSGLQGNTESHAFLYSGNLTVDLGTFGGRSSIGYSVNAAGQVVGAGYLDESRSHAFLYDGLELTDLGTLGGEPSVATGINDHGQVVGWSVTEAGDDVQAFICDADGLRGLGHLGGGGSYAVAINRQADVIGYSFTGEGEIHGFLYTDNTMTDLGTLGGPDSFAAAMNGSGVVVGESTTATGWAHGFVYSGGTMIDLGTLGGSYSSAIAINEAGQIIGESSISNEETRGFIYQNGSIADLGTLGGDYTSPNAINNLGQVVGTATTADGEDRAFLWRNGAMVDLNTLLASDTGWQLESAEFITDSGFISGRGSYNGANAHYILKLGTANTPPVAIAGTDQTGDCQSPVTLDGTGSYDADGDPLTFEWSMNGTVLGSDPKLTMSFPLGVSIVTLKVTDSSGEFSETTVTVRIADRAAPLAGSIAASPEVIMPPNHRMVAVTVSLTASDNCDPAPATRIVAITSNEPLDPEEALITGDLTALLAATRAPAGNGRVYTLHLAVTDASGNSSMSAVEVVVPKGNGSSQGGTRSLGIR